MSMPKSPVLETARKPREKIRAHNIMYPVWQYIKIKQMRHSLCAVFTCAPFQENTHQQMQALLPNALKLTKGK